MALSNLYKLFDFAWGRVLVNHLAYMGMLAPHLGNHIRLLSHLSKPLDVGCVVAVAFNMVDLPVGLHPPAEFAVI